VLYSTVKAGIIGLADNHGLARNDIFEQAEMAGAILKAIIDDLIPLEIFGL
jgi:hypothetical protein